MNTDTKVLKETRGQLVKALAWVAALPIPFVDENAEDVEAAREAMQGLLDILRDQTGG